MRGVRGTSGMRGSSRPILPRYRKFEQRLRCQCPTREARRAIHGQGCHRGSRKCELQRLWFGCLTREALRSMFGMRSCHWGSHRKCDLQRWLTRCLTRETCCAARPPGSKAGQPPRVRSQSCPDGNRCNRDGLMTVAVHHPPPRLLSSIRSGAAARTCWIVLQSPHRDGIAGRGRCRPLYECGHCRTSWP
jgi:hypothetical protein